MAKLTTKSRNALKSSDFALPGRKYPIHTKGHAEAALARISEFGTVAEKAQVRRKVKSKYPSMA